MSFHSQRDLDKLYDPHKVRKRSSSDGDLLTGESSIRNIVAENDQRVKLKISVEELTFPLHAGYLNIINKDDKWTQYWFVLKDNLLYQFVEPKDEITFDIISLNDCKIKPGKESAEGKLSFTIVGPHPECKCTVLSADNTPDLEKWIIFLNNNSSINNEAFLRLMKHNFLEEVLEQKEKIEKNQKRHACTRQRSMSHDFEGSLPYTFNTLPKKKSDWSPDDENKTRDITKLRQRKISTQLKIDSLQHNLKGDAKKDNKIQRISNIFYKSQSHHNIEPKINEFVNQEDLNSQLSSYKDQYQNICSELESKVIDENSLDCVDSVSNKHKKNKFITIAPFQGKRSSIVQSETSKSRDTGLIESKKDKNNNIPHKSIMRNQLRLSHPPERPQSLPLNKHDIAEKFQFPSALHKKKLSPLTAQPLFESVSSVEKKVSSDQSQNSHKKVFKSKSDSLIIRKKFDKFSYEYDKECLASIAEFEEKLIQKGIKISSS